MPIWRRRNRATPVSLRVSTRSPATVTVPLVGRSRPAIRLSSVDLPLPEGPMIATALAGRDLQADVVHGGLAAVVVALRDFADLDQRIGDSVKVVLIGIPLGGALGEKVPGPCTARATLAASRASPVRRHPAEVRLRGGASSPAGREACGMGAAPWLP